MREQVARSTIATGLYMGGCKLASYFVDVQVPDADTMISLGFGFAVANEVATYIGDHEIRGMIGSALKHVASSITPIWVQEYL